METGDNPKLIKNGGNGTNVGNALRWLVKQGKAVSPELLDLAGNITGIKQLSALGNAIRSDKSLPEADKTILLQEMENDMVEMVEITKRLQIDSEHAITRMIRPVSYAAMFVLFMCVVLFDGNLGSFTIDKAYVPVIQSLFGTMTIFYFGSRGIEKVMKTFKKGE
jgi:hypothetical protein|tara:strand:+ start:35 stop:529 length:495 start_codon:yes stop_codon:yes gene_type:complete